MGLILDYMLNLKESSDKMLLEANKSVPLIKNFYCAYILIYQCSIFSKTLLVPIHMKRL